MATIGAFHRLGIWKSLSGKFGKGRAVSGPLFVSWSGKNFQSCSQSLYFCVSKVPSPQKAFSWYGKDSR